MLAGILFFLKVIGVIAVSYATIHLLAVFGVFLGLAWPVWWLVAPEHSICLYCRAREEGEKCPLCQRIKEKSVRPKTLRSAVLNGALVGLLTLVSMGVVLGERWVLIQAGVSLTKKTVVFQIPDKGQYRLGEIFPMKIEITGIEKPVNAVQADIGFNPNRLEVVEVSTEDSFANIFIQEEINNEGGYVRLTGGLPNPGFFSDRGVFGTVLFRGKAPGLTQVEFLPSSMVLANDGRGSNVIKEFADASYLILPEKISEKEAELQGELLTKRVLGEQTAAKEQLKFYADDSVLGAFTKAELEEKIDGVEAGEVLGAQTKRGWEQALEWLAEKDEAIVRYWKKLLNWAG